MIFNSLAFELPLVILLSLILVPAFLYFRNQKRKNKTVYHPPLQYQKSKKNPKILVISIIESLIIVLVFVILAKPYNGFETISIEEKGIDIILAIDISPSMQAKDFKPNRLESTKKIVKDFISKNESNRLGIVVFTSHVFTLSPLSHHHEHLNPLVSSLRLNTVNVYESSGTAYGDALAYSIDMLKSQKMQNRDQVIILLTDGENNKGLDPLLAAKVATDHQIKVHTIGLGDSTPVTVQPRNDDEKWIFKTRLDDKPLKEIAKTTYGQYFHAKDEFLLEQIFNDLNRLSKTAFRVESFPRRKSATLPFFYALSFFFLLAFHLRWFFERRPLK